MPRAMGERIEPEPRYALDIGGLCSCGGCPGLLTTFDQTLLQDDAALEASVSKHGFSWAAVAKEIPNRTDNAVSYLEKNRHSYYAVRCFEIEAFPRNSLNLRVYSVGGDTGNCILMLGRY